MTNNGLLNKDILDRLTWYTVENVPRKTWPIGTILKDEDDWLYFVGDCTGDGRDLGCGCCESILQIISYAFISELL